MKLKLLFFVFLALLCQNVSFSQCAFANQPFNASVQSICYNTEVISPNVGEVVTTAVTVGTYVAVKVIKGYSYAIKTTNSDLGFMKMVTLFDSNATSVSLASATATANNTAISLAWTASFTGTLYVQFNNNSNGCASSTSADAITIAYTGGNNTSDSQTTYGIDTWTAHVYNFSNTAATPPSDAIAYNNYLGYFNVGTQNFAQNFGGSDTCFPYTANDVSANFRTDTFAIKYKMQSTLTGCYLVNVRGDDGVRLTIDGVKVLDRWVQQSPTDYGNVLVYLNGSSNLLLEYYEKNGGNESNFTMTPFVASANAITAPTPSSVCSGVTPGMIDGTSFVYNGATVNPTINFQWQSSSDNTNWSNIPGATLEDYTPAAITTTTTNVTVYYRRVVSAVAATASSCVYYSNSIAITTSPVGSVTVPVANSVSGISCSQAIASWSASTNASSYLLDVATDSGFVNILPSYSNLNVGDVTTYAIANLAPAATYYYRVRAMNGCNTTVSSGTISFTTTAFVPTTSAGAYKMCVDSPTTNILATATVNSGQYVILDVVKGFSYTFSIGDVFSGVNESLNIIDSATNNNVSPTAFSSAATGTSVNWVATFSGSIKIVLTTNDCSNTGATGGPMQLKLNSVGNTLDLQTVFGTDTWVGHVYNWTGASPPGGSSSPAALATTNPFTAANYVGYYNQNSEAFSQSFIGNTTCFPVLTNGVNRTDVYTEQFAVRYRMKSTRAAGCYIATMNADDGLRLYVDGALVFDAWKDQGNSTYGSVLIYLNGNSDLVFDYYENGGGNTVGFSLAPFVLSSNTITAPNPNVLCSGTAPGAITGTFTYNGATVNPTINFQWQSSTDNLNWTNIPGATLQNYTPAAVTTTTSNVIVYYRRIVVGSSAATSGCSYTSNVIQITTSAAIGTIGSVVGSTPQCVSSTGLIYSVSPVTNGLTYSWSLPSNWTITAGAGTNTITVSIAANGVSGNVSVTASNGCGTTAPTSLYVTVDPVPSKPGTATGNSITCTGYTAQWAYTNYATKYLLDVSTNAGFSTFVSGYSNLDVGNVTSYALTGLNPGTTYYYRVRANSNCGTSVSSNNMNFTTSPAPTVAPVANAASGAQCDAVTVNWNTVANATGYYLDIATNSGFTAFVTGYNNFNIGYSATSLYAGGLPAGTLYYRLRAYNSCGTTISSNVITFSTTAPVGGTIASAQTICSGTQPANLVLSGNTGTIIRWEKASDLAFTSPSTIGVTTATLSGTTIGNLSASTYFRAVVQFQYGAYCTTFSTPVLITVTSGVGAPVPITIAAGSQPICETANGLTTTYATSATNNTGFNWSLSNAAAGSINSSGVMTWANGFSGTVNIQVSAIGCNGMSSQVTRTVTILGTPATPSATATSQPSCTSSTGTITVSAPTGMNYSVDGINYSNTTGVFTGLAVGNYTVTAQNASGCVSLGTPVSINASTVNTWDGSAWSAGTPTLSQSLVFAGDYSSANSISGCSCQVDAGKTVTILSGGVLTITNAVTTNGKLIFENNSSLIQVNDAAVNTGSIIYKRKAQAMNNFDYTYWSSPVTGQTLQNLSPNTIIDKYFSFANNNWVYENYNAVMTPPGKGYIIRVPKPGIYSLPVGNPETVTMPYAQPVQFEGTPNNGSYPLTIDPAGSYNLIGNPYPSAMSADTFLATNTTELEGTIYFWTHNTLVSNTGYNTSDYASYNTLGGVGTKGTGNFVDANNNGTLDPGEEQITNRPLGNIAAGQSFFTQSKAGGSGSVVFNNSMRIGTPGKNGQFFKGTKSKTATVEKHRVWLNMTNTEGAFKQTLVGYVTGATSGYDSAFDGDSFDGNPYIDFYSVNEDRNLVIQGRPVPFDTNDKVPMGYKTTIDGTFAISIDQVDGVLVSQDVYIEDKVTHDIHNLKKGSYSFTTVKGTFNDRFVLRYTDNTVVVVPPVVVQPPVVIEPPVVTVPPVIVEPPVVIEPPVVVQPPVVIEPPVAIEPPVVVQPPVVVEPPVAIEPPVVVGPPVVVSPPIVIPPIVSLDPTLENPSFTKTEKPLVVSVKNHQIKINSFNETMTAVMVYDLKGSLLYENDHVNSNEFIIQHLNSGDQFLIVITQLTNGKWISKEIIFQN
jgi:hypothetical protein